MHLKTWKISTISCHSHFAIDLRNPSKFCTIHRRNLENINATDKCVFLIAIRLYFDVSERILKKSICKLSKTSLHHSVSTNVKSYIFRHLTVHFGSFLATYSVAVLNTPGKFSGERNQHDAYFDLKFHDVKLIWQVKPSVLI